MPSVNEIDGYDVLADYGSGAKTLGDAGIFTSAVIANRGADGPVRRVVGSVYANESGSLQVEGSVNGTTWRSVGSAVSVTASTLATFDSVVYHPLTRVVYTNGSTPNTVFEISISTRPN